MENIYRLLGRPAAAPDATSADDDDELIDNLPVADAVEDPLPASKLTPDQAAAAADAAAAAALFDIGHIRVDNYDGNITPNNIIDVMDALNNVDFLNSKIVDQIIAANKRMDNLLGSLREKIIVLKNSINNSNLGPDARTKLERDLSAISNDFIDIKEITEKVKKHEETSDRLTKKIGLLVGNINNLETKLQDAITSSISPQTAQPLTYKNFVPGSVTQAAARVAAAGGRKNKRKITKKVISKKSLSKKKLIKKKKNKAKKVTKKKKSGRKINKSYFKKNIYF